VRPLSVDPNRISESVGHRRITVRVRFPRIAFLFVCAVSLALPLAGQSPNGTINGRVLDPSNKVIVGADLLLINDATEVKYSGKTNDDGIYIVPNLPPGPYRLQVTKRGFKTLIKPDIVLNIQDALSINFTLPVGAAFEIVTVEGGASMINTTDGSVSTVVDQTFVKNMPLNGRSFQDLILLTPGVVTNSPQSQSSLNGNNGEFSVNGQRTESNYYTVDGVSVNTGVLVASVGPGNSGSVAVATALGTTQSIVSVDALQEFRVQSSTYSAEYGRNPGGQFSFLTRSGTSQWHGTAFDYLRNDYFDANNWFNNYRGKPEPPLRQNDFGGTLGGPIKIPGLYNGRDKTFFFFSYEGLRLIQPQAATMSPVPDSALRQATPAPLQQVLNAFSLPNGPEILDPATGNPTGLAEFIGTWSNPSSLDAYSVRFDHNFNDKLRVFFRFGDTGSSAATRDLGSAQTNPSVVEKSLYTSRTYTFGATSALSSRLGNDFRLNYSTNTSHLSDNADSFGGAEPLNLAQIQQINPSVNSYSVQAALFVGSFVSGLAQRSLFGSQRQWNLTDSVNISFGRHQFKFGIDYRRLTPSQGFGSPQVAYYFFGQDGVKVNNPNLAFAVNNADFYPLFRNFSAFTQDDWRVTQRLSLSMGLRWDVNPPPGVTQGPLPLTVQGISNLSTMTLAPAGTRPWNTAWYSFAPRLGAAYVLRNAPGHETVLRSGGGLFFDTGQQTGALGFLSPNYNAINVAAPGSQFPLSPAQAQPAINQNPTPPYRAIGGYPRHLQLPYTIQWNTTIEQALGNSQVLSVAYVGSHAGRLLETRQINISSFNQNFTNFDIFQNGATADYNALQVKFQRKISHGLTALASYTYGHSIDYGSSDLIAPYVRGNSNFDVRHNFSSAFSYDLPSVFQNRFARAAFQHWGFDNRVTARTGFPVTLDGNPFPDPVTGTTYNAGLDLVPGQPVYIYGSQCAAVYGNGRGCPGGRAINPNAFTNPPIDPVTGFYTTRLGNAPRNFARGFGAWQMDLAVRREFPIYEALRLQFRAEAFNVFNHPNFGTIDQNFCSPGPGTQCTFGQALGTLNSGLGILSPLYQTGGPRSMQLALKLVF
jgi:hypothetical protein